MRYLIAILATLALSAAEIPAGVNIGPAPTKAQIDKAVAAWVQSVKIERPGKLVIENVKLAGPAGWKHDWNSYRLKGVGADAFPQKDGYDYGWEVTFTTTTTDNDGRVSRRIPQAVLLIDGCTPRARVTVQ